jgi:RNA polymerase sigma-70 factor (ECF subfamily)
MVERNESLDAVVIRAQGGDQAAFGDIVTAYQSKVRSLAAVETKNLSDADDLAQDVFIVAFQKIGELKDPRKIWPWLRGIMRNEILNYRRTLDREDQKIEMLAETYRTLLRPEDTGPSALLEALEVCKRKLTERARNLVRMRYDDSCSFEQIGQLMQRPLNAIYALHFRVLEKLRACIGNEMRRT